MPEDYDVDYEEEALYSEHSLITIGERLDKNNLPFLSVIVVTPTNHGYTGYYRIEE